jgi:heat-inducible transcriptional repressor
MTTDKSKPKNTDDNSRNDAGGKILALTERQREILRIVIEEFVNTATPVSSELLVNKHKLPYSSATVRNELAELERNGFITQPHTSAGRIPSDLGYRFYVESLMNRSVGLSSVEQRNIQQQLFQLQTELNDWLRRAVSVTARTAHNAAVVSTPRTYDSRLKYMQLMGVQEKLALLIMVTMDGTLREQMVNLDEAKAQDDLTSVSNRLNTHLSNLNWRQIENRIKDWPDELAKTVAGRIGELLRQLDLPAEAQIYRDGLVNILSQPEFSDIARVRQVVQALESGQSINSIIPEVLSNDGNAVQVIIGGDNRFDDLRLLSVVLARYGIDGEVAGVVGIVGPTRMEYGRSISTVQYISQLLSDLLNERRPN